MSRLGYVVIETAAGEEPELSPEFFVYLDEARESAKYLNDTARALESGQSFVVAEVVELGDDT